MWSDFDPYLEVLLRVALTAGLAAAIVIVVSIALMFLSGALVMLGVIGNRNEDEDDDD